MPLERLVTQFVVCIFLCTNSNAQECVRLEAEQSVAEFSSEDPPNEYCLQTIGSGAYVVSIDQRNIDLTLSLDQPERQALSVTTPLYDVGPELLLINADASSQYVVSVRATSDISSHGSYQIRLSPVPERLAGALNSVSQAGVFHHDNPTKTSDVLAIYEAARSELEALQETTYLSWVTHIVASLTDKLGETEKAEALFKKTTDLYVTTGQDTWRRWALGRIGTIQLRNGEYDQAVDTFKEMEEGSTSANDIHQSAAAQNYIGLTYHYQNKLEEAEKYYLQTLETLSGIDYPHQAATTTHNLGGILEVRGEPTEALEKYSAALAIHRRLGDAESAAGTMGNIAGLYSSMGEISRALPYYTDILRYHTKVEDKPEVARVLNRIGSLYLALNELDIAQDFLTQGLAANEGIGNRPAEAQARSMLGDVAFRLGRFDDAIMNQREAKRIFASLGENGNSLLSLAREALSQHRNGDSDAAKTLIQEAVVNSRGETITSNNLGSLQLIRGELLLEFGDLEEATNALIVAQRIFVELSNPLHQVRANTLLARTSRVRGDLAAALQWAEKAITQTESLRNQPLEPSVKGEMLSTLRGAYDEKIHATIGRYAESPRHELLRHGLSASIASSSRILLETLQERQIDYLGTADSVAKNRIHALRREIFLQKRNLQWAAEESPTVGEEARRGLSGRQLELSELESRVRASRDVDTLGSNLPNVASIQGYLDADELVLHFHVAAEKSYRWKITSNQIQIKELPPGTDLNQLALSIHNALELGSSPTVADVRSLSAATLAELGDLSQYRRVMIVPDGALHFIPFGALEVGSEKLSDLVDISYLPTIAMLQDRMSWQPLTGDDAAYSALVVADPVFGQSDSRTSATVGQVAANPSLLRGAANDVGNELQRLHYSSAEADAISTMLGNHRLSVMSGFDASKSNLISALTSTQDIVHFATHGFVNVRHPELSGLALSEVTEDGAGIDGFLSMNDIYNFELDTKLVVLSACETSIGRQIRGEGLVSLSRAFMQAGTHSIVGSLWQVPDKATTEMMSYFYAYLINEQLPPEGALRQAQLKMQQSRRWKSPYYWSGFVVWQRG